MSRNVMQEFQIDFLSSVDRPAQEGAKSLLMKRDEPEDDGLSKRKFTAERRQQLAESGEAMSDGSFPIVTAADLSNAIKAFGRASAKARVARHIKARAKALKREDLLPDEGLLAKVETTDDLPTVEDHPHADQIEKCGEGGPPVVMTSSESGHSHLVYLHRRAGETTYQRSEGSDSGHDHPWMLTASADGTFALTIGDSEGHTHTVDQTILNAAFAAAALSKLFEQEDDQMAKPTTVTKTAEEIQALEDNLALARLFSTLGDGERSYFETLGDTGKRAFVAKDADERAAEIKKAAGPDEVIYTDNDGNTFRKSDDRRMLAAAKRADSADKRTEKAEQTLTQERLEKRADAELAHLPGTPKFRGALLKAVESIEDEDERAGAMKGLLAGNAAIGKGFDTIGVGGVEDELDIEGSSAESKLNKAAQTMAKEKGLTIEKAYSEVLKTPAGKQLYTESLQ